MNIKKTKNIDVILVEYRWTLTFNLTVLIKNLKRMISGLFETKMVWFQVLGGNLEGNRCVTATNTRVCKYNFGGIKFLVEAWAWDHLVSSVGWQAIQEAD